MIGGLAVLSQLLARYCEAHHFSDVISGSALGVAVAVLLRRIEAARQSDIKRSPTPVSSTDFPKSLEMPDFEAPWRSRRVGSSASRSPSASSTRNTTTSSCISSLSRAGSTLVLKPRPGRLPRLLNILCRHRLLRQPGGFEADSAYCMASTFLATCSVVFRHSAVMNSSDSTSSRAS